MPGLPAIVVYLEARGPRVVGRPLEALRISSPFLLRTVDPPVADMTGRVVRALGRLGKRIVFRLDDAYFIALHLMIAGRLRWKPVLTPLLRSAVLTPRPPLRNAERGREGVRAGGAIAAFDFSHGTLLVTEASKKHRASLHLVRGDAALAALDRGGLEVLEADLSAFREALTRERPTLNRALTDPRLFSGIGNAYSDEILHAARLSPLQLTSRLTDEEVERLYRATRATLRAWIERLRAETGDGFPEKVTAFREGMAVHGRYRKPCPVCGSAVQRIRYAENEGNSCPTCQTGGRLPADGALSRLLKEDWPPSPQELEARGLGPPQAS